MKSMRYIKLNGDKTPKEKLDKTYSYEEVKDFPDLGIIVDEPYVVFDVDNKDEFLTLKEIITNKEIKCNIMRTSRGGHFWFRSPQPLKNNIKIKTPLGITVDVRSWGKTSYVKVKQDNKWRQWCSPKYDFSELDEYPFWLQPINHNYELIGLKNGDGRNNTLFSYILVLSNYLSKDRVRETFHIINEYILGEKLDYKELETILRDEAFDNIKPNFFNKSKFLFDKYAKWILDNYDILRRNKLLYVYDDKFYSSDTIKIEQLLIKHIPSLSKTQRNEVLEYLRLTAPEAQNANYYYIVCKNCIVDIRDKKSYPWSKDFFVPNLLNVSYRADVQECEVIDKFMSRICEGDKEIEDLIYEMIGYCLIPTSKFQKAFVLYGDGANGKSTLLDLIINLIGDTNVSSLSFKEINHNFKLAEITDKLANIGDDISDEYITDSSMFKKLVSGEEIMVEKKHEHPYKIRNTATMIFATNNLPNMQDKSNGMIRRLCVIPFSASITKDSADYDPFIIDKLITDDAKSYVLNKALEGLQRVFFNHGFTEPLKVTELLDDYYREINNVIQFLEVKNDFEGLVANDLYNDYMFFCVNQHQQPYKLRRFNIEIRKRTEFNLKQMRKNGQIVQVWTKQNI